MEYTEATLYDVLCFRERKAALQEKMRTSCPKGVVVSLGMNIPGPVKSGSLIYESFLEGKRALEELLAKQGTLAQAEVLTEHAGYAAIYLVTGADRLEIKKKAVALEETHKLGRIFDIDVLGEHGNPMVRQEIGAGERTCLICKKSAKECGRSRTHSVKELQEKVKKIMESWKWEVSDDR